MTLAARISKLLAERSTLLLLSIQAAMTQALKMAFEEYLNLEAESLPAGQFEYVREYSYSITHNRPQPPNAHNYRLRPPNTTSSLFTN